MSLTRREFLKLSGGALAGLAFPERWTGNSLSGSSRPNIIGSLGTQGVDSKYGVTKGSVDTRLGQAKDGGTDYQLV